MDMIGIVTSLALVAQASPQAHASPHPGAGRLYGIVTTTDGERVEGFLRWDRNETHWADFLDARREIALEHERDAERLDADLRARRQRERSITLPNVRITWDEDDGMPLATNAFAVRFVHLRALEVLSGRRARLDLQTGESVEVVAGSSDLGGGFRGLVVEIAPGDTLAFDWDEFERVDFRSAPEGRAPPASRRLFGTLVTREGVERSGLVAWDLDEALTTDVLDGERTRQDVRIPFGEVASIARETGRSARVTLTNGEVIVLGGSNDVDASNRGIEITDMEFGRTVVGWDEFVSLRLDAGTPEASSEVAMSGRLRGTVAGADGRRATGRIRWNNVAEYTWEALHAVSAGADLTIAFERVLSIAKGAEGARVTLVDGRVLDVDDGGDFTDQNRGVFVETDAGALVMVPWSDLLTVTFER